MTSYQKFKKEFDQAVVKSTRNPEEVHLLAVSKTHPAEKVRAVYLEGQRHFGENYVQEALEKQTQLNDLQITWHFIGSLQRNKVKQVVGAFALIHSVDSFALAKKISECAQAKAIIQNCLLQINIGDEESKGGFAADSILSEVEKLFALSNICWQGLMTMPPITSDEKIARGYLQTAKKVFTQIKGKLTAEQQQHWVHLSMGTSHDYGWAIEEGATMVRIGTLIFGQRERKQQNV